MLEVMTGRMPFDRCAALSLYFFIIKLAYVNLLFELVILFPFFFFFFFSSRPRSEQCLVRWATPQLHEIDSLEQMVDPALRGLYPPKSLSRFADIIALCVQVRNASITLPLLKPIVWFYVILTQNSLLSPFIP